MSHYIAQQPEIVMCTLSRKATVGQGRRRGKLQHMGGLHSMRAALVLGSTTLLRASSSAALASFARVGGLASRVGRASRSPPSPAQHLCAACQAEKPGPSQGKGASGARKGPGQVHFCDAWLYCRLRSGEVGRCGLRLGRAARMPSGGCAPRGNVWRHRRALEGLALRLRRPMQWRSRSQ